MRLASDLDGRRSPSTQSASTAPDATESTTTNQVVGSNAISVAAATREAAALGFATFTLPGWLDGDVGDAAALLHVTALTVDGDRPTAILAGGETSVRVTGTGKGGRNQELALRFAVLCAERPLPRAWVFLSGGTDGRDGPTDAAGAVVTPGTLDAIAAAGVSVEGALADNDAYRALQAADALLTTGATGTNVADLQVLLI